MHEGHRSRMVDKVLSNSDILTEHEILEVLLFNAIPRKNTNEIAHKLLDTFGSIKNIFQADVFSLMSVEGVGKSCASYIITIGKCIDFINNEQNKLPKVYSYEECKNYLIRSFKNAKEENFVALYLDARDNVILRKIFSSHSQFMVDINLEELLKGTLVKKPKSVVIAHNHTSGNVKPSFADDRATEKICLALRLNGIKLADHVIISGDKAFSYKLDGDLEGINKNTDLML